MTADDAATVLVGPLGPPAPDEARAVVDHAGSAWLVSARSATGSLRLSDVNPSGKLQIRAAPDAAMAQRLGVAVGEAELFDDGTLLAGVAPGEWLALTPGDAMALAAQVAALADPGDRPVIADRSDGLALFRLTGAEAEAVLAECCTAVQARPVTPGTVLAAPVAGCRSHVVRDDLPCADPVAGPPVPSFLVVCDRSVAPAVRAALFAAGASAGLEAEGFAAYRAGRADV
jgi:sarcosine oxidase gamma subunit